MKMFFFILTLWLIAGSFVSIHVNIESYRWRKLHGLPNYKAKLWLEVAILLTVHMLNIALWPLNLAFYNFWLQEELNEARGI